MPTHTLPRQQGTGKPVLSPAYTKSRLCLPRNTLVMVVATRYPQSRHPHTFPFSDQAQVRALVVCQSHPYLLSPSGVPLRVLVVCLHPHLPSSLTSEPINPSLPSHPQSSLPLVDLHSTPPPQSPSLATPSTPSHSDPPPILPTAHRSSLQLSPQGLLHHLTTPLQTQKQSYPH